MSYYNAIYVKLDHDSSADFHLLSVQDASAQQQSISRITHMHLGHKGSLEDHQVPGFRLFLDNLFKHWSFPKLVELTISVRQTAQEPTMVPMLTIPPACLPQLSSLVLCGVVVKLDSGFPRLTSLTLAQYPGSRPGLTLHGLLHALASCPNLQILKIDRILSEGSLDPAPCNPGYLLPRLHTLEIIEAPTNLPYLYAHLRLPAIRVTRLESSFRRRAMGLGPGRVIPVVPCLSTMLPLSSTVMLPSLQNLPAEDPLSVFLEVSRTGFLLTCRNYALDRRSPNPFTVTGRANLDEDSLRVQVYAEALSALSLVLGPRKVGTLHIKGDFSLFVPSNTEAFYTRIIHPPLPPQSSMSTERPYAGSSEPDWAFVLSRLPHLQELVIIDTARVPAFPAAFIKALQSPYVCPQLQKLELQSLRFDPSRYFVDSLASALRKRRETPALHCKWLRVLSLTSFEPEDAGLIPSPAGKNVVANIAKNALRGCADEVTVTC
ncbi:hypothetical protein C8Q76DRAFT_816461 [Earliella scabrosa]|nr:hypothetical protein C8Q76DRAFT_816461 [Earliella scabrosa]